MRAKTLSERATTREQRDGLKAVCARALRRRKGTNFSLDTRVSEPQLSRYANDTPDFMPIDIVADLERVLEYPFISEHLVGMHGYRLVKDDEDCRQPDMSDVGDISDSQGKLLSALIRALIDNHIDINEQRELLPLADDLILKLQLLKKRIKAVRR